MLSSACKIITLIIVLGSVGGVFFALYELPLGLEQHLPVLKDKNLYNYFLDIKEYIEAGPVGSLIIENADYEDRETKDRLNGLVNLISKRDNLTIPPFRIWYQGVDSLMDGVAQSKQIQIACINEIDPEIDTTDFIAMTKHYLRLGMKDKCCLKYGFCGGQFYEDITFSKVLENEKISVTKINFFHSRLREQSDYIKATKEIREIVEYLQEHDKQWPKGVKIYPYSLFYVFFEQYFGIKGVAVQNYLLSILFLLTLASVN